MSALLAFVEHSWFCLDLHQTWQVHSKRRNYYFTPENNPEKAERPSVAFILWFGSGTNNVHSCRIRGAQGQMFSAAKRKKEKCAENTFRSIYIYGARCLCVCEHLPVYAVALLMETSPRQTSPEFRVQVQISLWRCFLFGKTSEGARRTGAQESKNLGRRLIRRGCLKDEQELRTEMQKGFKAAGECVNEDIRNKTRVRERPEGGKWMSECDGPKKEE